MKQILWMSAFVLPLCACTPNYPRLPPLPEQAPPLTTADAAMMQQINEHDLTQIAMSKLASDHALAEAVKTLGANAVKDYTDHRNTLAALASQHNLTVTETLLARDQATVDRLSKVHGPVFDRAYVKALQSEADATKSMMATVVSSSKTAELKTVATAAQTLDARYISSAYSWLPQYSTRKHRGTTGR